jgi:cytidine deaminase
MHKKQILVEYIEAQSLQELSETDQALVIKAREILLKAYSPYSGFSVGAAVLLDNGVIITGSNQENVAYPSGICAERAAVYYAGAQYPDSAILAIAIAAGTKGRFTKKPAYPCGACRQVLLEARNRSGKVMKVILAGKEKIELISDARDLLPLPFENLDS